MNYKIKSYSDIEALSEKYEDNQLFRVENSYEELTIPDMKFFHDAGQGSDYIVTPIL